MLITGQLRYLMRDIWKIEEIAPLHIKCRLEQDDNMFCEHYIEVKKIEIDGVTMVDVSLPLGEGHGGCRRFYSEMMAYEYIEDYVMEPIDNLEHDMNNMLDSIIHKKRKVDKNVCYKRKRQKIMAE